MGRKLIGLVRTSLVSFIGMFTVAAHGAVAYSLTDLGTLGGTYSFAYGINNSGQVVGYSAAPVGKYFYDHAFLYSGGAMVDLGLLRTPFGTATGYAINDAGVVVGTADSSAGNQPFRYTGGMESIGSLGSIGDNEARGLNKSGQIVGYAATSTGHSHAFLYSGGQMQDLGTLSGLGNASSSATAINTAGQVVGSSTTNSIYSWQHAFLYDGTGMHDLGTLGGLSSGASAINDSGTVVGTSATFTGPSRAFVYTNGAMQSLGTLSTEPYAESYAQDINDSGDIVGAGSSAGGVNPRAMLFTDGTMYDLNTLVPTNSGFVLNWAYGINDVGQIVGCGTTSTGQTHGFLLTPIPEPTTAGLMGLGLACLALRRDPTRCRRR